MLYKHRSFSLKLNIQKARHRFSSLKEDDHYEQVIAYDTDLLQEMRESVVV